MAPPLRRVRRKSRGLIVIAAILAAGIIILLLLPHPDRTATPNDATSIVPLPSIPTLSLPPYHLQKSGNPFETQQHSAARETTIDPLDTAESWPSVLLSLFVTKRTLTTPRYTILCDVPEGRSRCREMAGDGIVLNFVEPTAVEKQQQQQGRSEIGRNPFEIKMDSTISAKLPSHVETMRSNAAKLYGTAAVDNITISDLHLLDLPNPLASRDDGGVDGSPCHVVLPNWNAVLDAFQRSSGFFHDRRRRLVTVPANLWIVSLSQVSDLLSPKPTLMTAWSFAERTLLTDFLRFLCNAADATGIVLTPDLLRRASRTEDEIDEELEQRAVLVSALFTFLPIGCDMHGLTSQVAGRGLEMIVVRNRTRSAFDDAETIADCHEKGNNAGGAVMMDHRLPFLCDGTVSAQDNVASTMVLEKAVKWGTKTALLLGKVQGRSALDGSIVLHPVAVKLFHAAQYKEFAGFHSLMHSNLRSPYINYPDSSCLTSSTGLVIQTQPFLGKLGGEDVTGASNRNLLQYLKHRKESKRPLTVQEQVELSMQIVCAFDHLHQHPMGYFTFDDNHPEQYFVREQRVSPDGPLRLHLTMVDIDTLQLAERRPKTPAVAVGARREGADYMVRCRCYYCHGRADCLFINTLEGFTACGQADHPHEAGDKEGVVAVAVGKKCSGTTDTWFMAQLFSMIVTTGQVPWQSVDLGEVVDRLRKKVVPRLTTKSTDPHAVAMIDLVNEMFSQRVSDAVVLSKLTELCVATNCNVPKCAPATLAPFPYRSPFM